MASHASRGSEATKRPIKSSDEETETVSCSKKIKTETVCEELQEKMPQMLKSKSSDLPLPESSNDVGNAGFGKSSVIVSSKNLSKRSGDVLSDASPPLSPSKKRKTLDAVDQRTGQQYTFTEEIDKRRKKLKRKALLKAVLEQMEFYFSDCNLSKDRFLRKLYDCTKDGYVDLSVFENFNKLQSLDKDGIHADILCKALSKSQFLEVNEDQTKVRRRTPFVEPNQEDVDRRTIYVENLPEHASHSWIQKIFMQCGRVCYVSLPKYKTTKEIKGFAFVEFSSPEEAEKACKMLNNPPPAKTEEKAGKFPKWNKTLRSLHKSAPPIKTEEQDSNEENVLNDSKEEQMPTPTKKKKKNSSKRKAEESVDKLSASEQSDGQDEKKKRKKKKKKVAAMEIAPVDSKDMKQGSKVECDVQTDRQQESSDKDSDKKIKDRGVESENKIDVKTAKSKKKKKRKKKVEVTVDQNIDTEMVENAEKKTVKAECMNETSEREESEATNEEGKLSRRERKRLRQEDIRRKKAERELKAREELKEEKQIEMVQPMVLCKSEAKESVSASQRTRLDSLVSESSETESPSKVYIKSDGSQVTSILGKSRRQDVVKKVEFDPVPITTEFVERKEIRRRKKPKRDTLHLRVLSKKEWLDLRAEYIQHQKTHMSALKESLRELRMQENGGVLLDDEKNGKKHVDLANVFGTKRMKVADDVKLAHVEELKFIPNVIVQWKSSHEISRNKIRTMFTEINSESIAYIEGKEEAKSGYIRFKDESSAEEFARLSRSSDSFSARVLPESQQASYWEKANRDRIAKLSKKNKERGTDKIARKVFERNKATFLAKGSRVVFDDDDDVEEAGGREEMSNKDKAAESVQDEDPQSITAELENVVKEEGHN